MGRRWWGGWCCFLVCAGLAGSAHADATAELRERLRLMEQSVKELQAAQRDRGAVVAESASQTEQVRAEFQAIQGAIDAVGQQLRMYMEEMNRFRQDIEQRLTTIEEQLRIGGLPAGAAPRPTTTGPTSGVAPSGSAPAATVTGPASGTTPESQAYQKALGLVHGGDYLGAANAFRQFQQAYPRSALAPNAQFWVGDCSYAVRDYQKAIKEYQAVVERYPRHEKANAALLKQGLAFEALGMAEEAKLFLQKLVAKAPESPEAKKAAERLKTLATSKSKADK